MRDGAVDVGQQLAELAKLQRAQFGRRQILGGAELMQHREHRRRRRVRDGGKAGGFDAAAGQPECVVRWEHGGSHLPHPGSRAPDFRARRTHHPAPAESRKRRLISEPKRTR
jgi:hypothetical protein